MRLTDLFIILLTLLFIAGCYHSQPSSSVKKYEEVLDPLVYSADKDYMTKIFGEPSDTLNTGKRDIWNYYIPLDDKSNTSSQWYSNTSTNPYQKFHNITLFFEQDTLVRWTAQIRD